MYICDNVPDDVTIDEPHSLEWTTDPPKETGYYWVIAEIYELQIVYYDKETDQILYMGQDWVYPEVTSVKPHWLGPLPEPTLPKA